MLPTHVLNIAHRGARSLAPENTILAAQKGLSLGADLWELDVAMSNDGEMVIIHDDTLTRTSNAAERFPNRAPWSVSDFSFADLRSLDFGSWFIQKDPFGQIKNGNVSPLEQSHFSNLQIPTLQEALQFTKDNHWKVNIEIKDLTGTAGDSIICENVSALVREMEMTSSVIISSFNHQYLRRVKKALPEVQTAALVDEPALDPVSLLKEIGAIAYNPGLEHLDFSQVAAVRQAGYGVNVWTVNDLEIMRKLISAGVTGIFTDFPQLFSEI